MSVTPVWGQTEERGSLKPPPPGLPAPAALGSLRDGISSAASPTTLRTQTSAFSTAYDGAKPKRF